MKEFLKKYGLSMGILAIFEAVAITLWLTKDNLFYLFNFTYNGVCKAMPQGCAVTTSQKNGACVVY